MAVRVSQARRGPGENREMREIKLTIQPTKVNIRSAYKIATLRVKLQKKARQQISKKYEKNATLVVVVTLRYIPRKTCFANIQGVTIVRECPLGLTDNQILNTIRIRELLMLV